MRWKISSRSLAARDRDHQGLLRVSFSRCRRFFKVGLFRTGKSCRYNIQIRSWYYYSWCWNDQRYISPIGLYHQTYIHIVLPHLMQNSCSFGNQLSHGSLKNNWYAKLFTWGTGIILRLVISDFQHVVFSTCLTHAKKKRNITVRT